MDVLTLEGGSGEGKEVWNSFTNNRSHLLQVQCSWWLCYIAASVVV